MCSGGRGGSRAPLRPPHPSPCLLSRAGEWRWLHARRQIGQSKFFRAFNGLASLCAGMAVAGAISFSLEGSGRDAGRQALAGGCVSILEKWMSLPNERRGRISEGGNPRADPRGAMLAKVKRARGERPRKECQMWMCATPTSRGVEIAQTCQPLERGGGKISISPKCIWATHFDPELELAEVGDNWLAGGPSSRAGGRGEK